MPVYIFQVTTLVAQKGPSRSKKGQSPKAHVLSAAVQMATEHFIMKGEEIANENQEIRNDMLAAVDDVRVTGAYSVQLVSLLDMVSFLYFPFLSFSFLYRSDVSQAYSHYIAKTLFDLFS